MWIWPSAKSFQTFRKYIQLKCRNSRCIWATTETVCTKETYWTLFLHPFTINEVIDLTMAAKQCIMQVFLLGVAWVWWDRATNIWLLTTASFQHQDISSKQELFCILLLINKELVAYLLVSLLTLPFNFATCYSSSLDQSIHTLHHPQARPIFRINS